MANNICCTRFIILRVVIGYKDIAWKQTEVCLYWHRNECKKGIYADFSLQEGSKCHLLPSCRMLSRIICSFVSLQEGGISLKM